MDAVRSNNNEIRKCPDLNGARLCRRPAAAVRKLLRLVLRAQPRPANSKFGRCLAGLAGGIRRLPARIVLRIRCIRVIFPHKL